MATALLESAVAKGRRVPGFATSAILVFVAVVLGYLGWILPNPGGSLVVPTLQVFGIGFVAAIGCRFVTGNTWAAVATLAIAAMAAVWTFEFSLPASLAWDPSATASAQSALLQATATPKYVHGVVAMPCSTKLTGSVGPMTAPYSQCASYSSFGNFVSFAASSNPYVGLGYTAGDGAAIFRPCSRHLVGDWWMFTMGTGGDGGCPVGYQFRKAG